MRDKRPNGARPMTPEQIEEAARRDPDARPLTSDDLKRMRRTPQVKIIRRALGLTQEEFAARYRIPVGTLRDWEQRRTEPDQPARAYLTVIARDPEAVRRALAVAPPRLPAVPFEELMRDLEEDRNAR
jgi:putative transcriptional regulator